MRKTLLMISVLRVLLSLRKTWRRLLQSFIVPVAWRSTERDSVCRRSRKPAGQGAFAPGSFRSVTQPVSPIPCKGPLTSRASGFGDKQSPLSVERQATGTMKLCSNRRHVAQRQEHTPAQDHQQSLSHLFTPPERQMAMKTSRPHRLGSHGQLAPCSVSLVTYVIRQDRNRGAASVRTSLSRQKCWGSAQWLHVTPRRRFVKINI